MARIMAIDYGTKRVGIAVTDELQIISTGLTTVHSSEIFSFMESYIAKEPVELILVGDPNPLGKEDMNMKKIIDGFVVKVKKLFPAIPVGRMNERYSSMSAQRAIREAGANKSTRRNKELVDKISATILLQEYMANRPT